MAQIFPFHAYRYTAQSGPLENLVTQPYDKITPAMQRRYLGLSPYNIVRVILGERLPLDSEDDNVYTRARWHLESWIGQGILARDPEPALYAYFQEFEIPDSGERALRQGFIGLGAVEDYAAGTVHRHEQTLSAPKQDRLELLRHTRAHCGQIFMLYPDPRGEVDRLLDKVGAGPPAAAVRDEYGVLHTLWRITGPAGIEPIQQVMADKKLVIADGHHRYETALAFRDENPGLAGADRVMMTFVNLHSPGLKILATHRVVRGMRQFDAERFLRRARELYEVTPLAAPEDLKKAWREQHPELVRMGAALPGGLYLFETARRPDMLDVRLLHQEILENLLSLGEVAIREERHLVYVRSLEEALELVRSGAAQAAFLLEPVNIEEMARIALAGGVMPQKSTDFYPKLLSGLTIYRL